jgi:hypothetical protein
MKPCPEHVFLSGIKNSKMAGKRRTLRWTSDIGQNREKCGRSAKTFALWSPIKCLFDSTGVKFRENYCVFNCNRWFVTQNLMAQRCSMIRCILNLDASAKHTFTSGAIYTFQRLGGNSAGFLSSRDISPTDPGHRDCLSSLPIDRKKSDIYRTHHVYRVNNFKRNEPNVSENMKDTEKCFR